MIAVVTGTREHADRRTVWAMLDRWREAHGLDVLVDGKCPSTRGGLSVDECAHRWAERKELATVRCPADWGRHRGAAGPIRNGEMGDRLLIARAQRRRVVVLAFPGGDGTASMRREALRRRLPLFDADVDAQKWLPAVPFDDPGGAGPTCAVSVQQADALRLLRGGDWIPWPKVMAPPSGHRTCRADQHRVEVGPGGRIALHCSSYGRPASVSGVALDLLQAIRGKVFAVADIGEQDGDRTTLSAVWQIPAVATPGAPLPWRVPMADGARIGNRLHRLAAHRRGLS